MINKNNELPSFVNETNLPKIVDKLTDAKNIKISNNKYGNRVQTVIDKIVEKADDITKAIKQEVINDSYSFKVGTGDVDVSADVEDGFGEVGVKGVTYQNLWNINKVNGATIEGNTVKVLASANDYKFCGIYLKDSCLKPNTTYTLITNVFENTLDGRFNPCVGHSASVFKTNAKEFQAKTTGVSISVLTTTSAFTTENIGVRTYVLNDCTEGFIKYSMLILEGDHTNNPNLPSYFEGIVGVGDKSKNLLNINTENHAHGVDFKFEKNVLKSSGIGSVSILQSFKITGLTIGKTYTISCNSDDVGVNSNGTILSLTPTTYRSFVFNDTESIYFQIRQDVDCTKEIKFLLEEGTKATSYEPYYDGHKIEILSNGKNFWNENINPSIYKGWGQYSYKKTYDGFTFNSVAGWNSLGFDFSILKNKTVYVSADITLVNRTSDKVETQIFRIGNTNYPSNDGIYLTQGQTKRLTQKLILDQSSDIYFFGSSNTEAHGSGTISWKVSNIQIEVSDNFTNYASYQEDKSQILLDEPLMRLPNGTHDEITRDGKLIRRVGKVILDGSEAWSNTGHGGHSTKNTFEIKLPYTGGLNVADSLCYCNRFPQGITSGVPEEGMYRVVYDGYVNKGIFLLFSPKISEIPYRDTNVWKQWLSKNPTTVYYELAEPITTELSAPYLRIFKDGHLTFNTLVAPESNHVVQLNKSAQIERSIREVQSLDGRVGKLESFYDDMMLETSHKLSLLNYDFEYTRERNGE